MRFRRGLLSPLVLPILFSVRHIDLGQPRKKNSVECTGVTEAFKADNDPRKINLGVGAYRDENGKPYVLKAVKKVRLQVIIVSLRVELDFGTFVFIGRVSFDCCIP